jgi:hypothetical protein
MPIAFVDKKYLASGADVLDAKYIAKESFVAKCPPQERERWTDANGGSHPVYYPYRVMTVEFMTSAMDDAMLDTFRAWFTSRYTSGTRMLPITAWCADEGAYITQNCDMIEFEPIHDRRLNATDGNAYQSFTIKLRGRGGTV